MKLVIRRNQADVKGLFGGHKGVSFSLFGKCSVSDAERALIDRYKVGDYILASYTVASREPIEFNIRVNDLISGATHHANDIQTLLQLEEEMKSGCNNLKTLLSVMASFGGEQTFETSRAGTAWTSTSSNARPSNPNRIIRKVPNYAMQSRRGGDRRDGHLRRSPDRRIGWL